MMAYIRATANISPQKTFDNTSFLTEMVEHTGNRLNCVEPDYKTIIDAKLIRRMSRIIKMGVTAGLKCLHEADINVPDAIVTGTAYGCLEDTISFLTKMIEQDEQLLTPTAFIQSTHNTIGAQIALQLQCKSYNNAFVHRGFSFENALLDGIMLLKEREVNNVLVGAIDEITDVSHGILTRFGLYKKEAISNLHLFKTHTKGTIAGEGAAFFLLTNQPSTDDYAQLKALTTFYKPNDKEEIEQRITSFLATQKISPNSIDLILLGRNGDIKNDKIYNQLEQSVFKNNKRINYKHLCGEYPTSTAFALWLAANIIKKQHIPEILQHSNDCKKDKINNVLIYNNYHNLHHSLLLINKID